MRARCDPPVTLLHLAGLQAGVLSLEQAEAHGVGRNSVARLVRQRRWQPLSRGIYATHPGDVAWGAWAWAGLLVAGSGSVLGGAAALHLHELADPPHRIDVWVGGTIAPRPHERWRFRRDLTATSARRVVGEPARLRVEPALLDQVDESDAGAAGDLVQRALQSSRTSPSALRAALHGRRRARHRQLVLDMLDETAAGIESPLERRYIRSVERAHALPAAIRQHHAHGARRDNYYAAYGLVVELDGRTHEGAGRHRDMLRDNAATLSGERTLRFGWRDVDQDPCRAAAQVARLLTLGGWPGVLARCRRCSRVPDLDAAAISV